MQETDLLAFQIAIKESDVGTVMCAYNKLNSVYTCEDPYLLTDVLKKSWDYQGLGHDGLGRRAQHGSLRPRRPRPGNAQWHSISAMRSRRRWKKAKSPWRA